MTTQDETPRERGDDAPDRKRLNPLQIVGSVLAAAFGVQSSRNRERDFRHGRPAIFIAAGIVFTLLFIGVVIAVVRLVLAGA